MVHFSLTALRHQNRDIDIMLKKSFIITSILLLVACGYKGPLYLPQNKPAPSNPDNNIFTHNINPNKTESSISTPKISNIIESNIESKI